VFGPAIQGVEPLGRPHGRSAHHKLKEAQEQALHSERLATLGQMVAGIAHESRNAPQLIQGRC
jgi:C4-dicarboxylate-specific signal transduction histidine kinase